MMCQRPKTAQIYSIVKSRRNTKGFDCKLYMQSVRGETGNILIFKSYFHVIKRF